MNTREKEFAEFAFKCIVGRSPITERDRHQVLEIRDALKKEFRSPEFKPVRDKIANRFKLVKKSISASLSGPDKDILKVHL